MTQSNGEIEQMIMTRFGMDLTEDWYDSYRYEDRVMLRDWIIADRKQHELELLNRLEEQGRPGVSSDGQKTLVINVSAIEAERERLGK